MRARTVTVALFPAMCADGVEQRASQGTPPSVLEAEEKMNKTANMAVRTAARSGGFVIRQRRVRHLKCQE